MRIPGQVPVGKRLSWSRRWLCSASGKNEPAESSVFLVAGRNDYRTIDQKGIVAPYIPPWEKKMRITSNVSNSCDGMMLVPFKDSFFLFNPTTKYFQKVLQLDIPYNETESRYSSCLGLCYDPSIDDYKALLLSRDKPPFVAQATLKGKQWTKLDFPFNFLGVEPGPVFNGRLHWLADQRGVLGNHIICFDPVSNDFEILPSPRRNPDTQNYIVGIEVVDGCLWMARWKLNSWDFLTGEVELLKMKEYGVQKSWKRMHVFSEVTFVKEDLSLKPLLITESGQVLMSRSRSMVSNQGEILVYDPATKFCRPHCTTRLFYPQSIPFVKNSVSPSGLCWDPLKHQHFGALQLP